MEREKEEDMVHELPQNLRGLAFLKNQRYWLFIIGFVAINLSIGGIVSFFKLPIYMDSLGIVLAAITLGVVPAIVVALLTCGLGFFLINPYLPAYVGTSIVIAMITGSNRRLNLYSTIPKVVAAGLLTAVFAAISSAPVTALVFGGATLSGNDAITSFFLASGHALLQSVLLSGLTSEPIDKILVSILAYGILRSLPMQFYTKQGLRFYRD